MGQCQSGVMLRDFCAIEWKVTHLHGSGQTTVHTERGYGEGEGEGGVNKQLRS